MRTYILSRNLETMFQVYNAEDKKRYLNETLQICAIRFNMNPDRYLPWYTMPEVAMWEDYEAALLMYYEAQIEDALKYAALTSNLAVGALAKQHQEQADKMKQLMWGDTPEAATGGLIGMNLANPILDATDELIVSHCVDLVRSNPVIYTKFYPYLTDLSVPFVTQWDYSGQDY